MTQYRATVWNTSLLCDVKNCAPHAYIKSIRCEKCNSKLSPGYSSYDENDKSVMFLSYFICKYDCDNCKLLYMGCPLCNAVLPRIYSSLSYCTEFIRHIIKDHGIHTNFAVMGDGIYIKNLSNGFLVYMQKVLMFLPQLLLLSTDINFADIGICKNTWVGNPYILTMDEFYSTLNYLYDLGYKCFSCDAEYETLPSEEVITEHLIACLITHK